MLSMEPQQRTYVECRLNNSGLSSELSRMFQIESMSPIVFIAMFQRIYLQLKSKTWNTDSGSISGEDVFNTLNIQ